MKTPIQELFEGSDYTLSSSFCQRFLKLEKEFAHKCFIAGADYGLDLSASIEWGENGTMPTFDEFYKEFQDE